MRLLSNLRACVAYLLHFSSLGSCLVISLPPYCGVTSVVCTLKRLCVVGLFEAVSLYRYSLEIHYACIDQRELSDPAV